MTPELPYEKCLRDNIPQELRDRQWVTWRARAPEGQATKVPYRRAAAKRARPTRARGRASTSSSGSSGSGSCSPSPMGSSGSTSTTAWTRTGSIPPCSSGWSGSTATPSTRSRQQACTSSRAGGCRAAGTPRRPRRGRQDRDLRSRRYFTMTGAVLYADCSPRFVVVRAAATAAQVRHDRGEPSRGRRAPGGVLVAAREARRSAAAWRPGRR